MTDVILSPVFEAIYEVVPGTRKDRVKPKYAALLRFLVQRLAPRSNDTYHDARVQIAMQLAKMPAAERDMFADRLTACDLVIYLSRDDFDTDTITLTVADGVDDAVVQANRQTILNHLKTLDPEGPLAPEGPWDVCSHCGASTAIELPRDGGVAGGREPGTVGSFKLIVTCTGPRCFNIEVARRE
jgi:hypothetical protein